MMVSGAKKGEVTAYLSLIFILFISFVGGIMESASVQMAKNYRRADMNRARSPYLQSIRKNFWMNMRFLHWKQLMKQGRMAKEI